MPCILLYRLVDPLHEVFASDDASRVVAHVVIALRTVVARTLAIRIEDHHRSAMRAPERRRLDDGRAGNDEEPAARMFRHRRQVGLGDPRAVPAVDEQITLVTSA